MTKKEIADFLKKKYTISNEDALQIVECFFQTIQDLSRQSGGVVVQNLGKFEFKERLVERNIRNFAKGDSTIARMKTAKIYFTPSKSLKNF